MGGTKKKPDQIITLEFNMLYECKSKKRVGIFNSD